MEFTQRIILKKRIKKISNKVSILKILCYTNSVKNNKRQNECITEISFHISFHIFSYFRCFATFTSLFILIYHTPF